MKYILCCALILTIGACSLKIGADKLSLDAKTASRVEATSPQFPPLLPE